MKKFVSLLSAGVVATSLISIGFAAEGSCRDLEGKANARCIGDQGGEKMEDIQRGMHKGEVMEKAGKKLEEFGERMDGKLGERMEKMGEMMQKNGHMHMATIKNLGQCVRGVNMHWKMECKEMTGADRAACVKKKVDAIHAAQKKWRESREGCMDAENKRECMAAALAGMCGGMTSSTSSMSNTSSSEASSTSSVSSASSESSSSSSSAASF